MNADPIAQAIAAIIDPLTAPHKEDWVVLCDHDHVHIAAIREWREGADRRVVARSGRARLSEFKSLVEQLPDGHDLGLVQVIAPTDVEATGGLKLLAWLTVKACEKHFNVTSVHGIATTREAAAVLAESTAAP